MNEVSGRESWRKGVLPFSPLKLVMWHAVKISPGVKRATTQKETVIVSMTATISTHSVPIPKTCGMEL